MPVPAIISHPLRLLPRNVHRASKHGLYIPRRQISLFEFWIKDKKALDPSKDSKKDGQPPRQPPSQFDQSLQSDQQPSESYKTSDQDDQPTHQTSQFDRFLQLDPHPDKPSKFQGKKGRKKSRQPSQFGRFHQLDQEPSEPSKASDENSQSSRQLLNFEEYLLPDQEPSEPSRASGKDSRPFRQPSKFEERLQLGRRPPEPSVLPALDRYRRVLIRLPKRVGRTKGHYWQSDFALPNSPISYHRTRLAKPLVASRGWLRDACTCEKCVNPSSGQKNYASSDVPLELDISSLAVTEEGELLVHWKNDFHTHDTHVSRYPRSLWDRTDSGKIETIPRPKIWGCQAMTEASPYYSYHSFMMDGPEYRQAMTALSELGLIFLRDMPSSEDTVKDVASRLGLIQDTFYGTTWDVRSKPNAENVAYTNSYLGLHQDLLYMSNVPRIQILHCLENTCEGGESIFSDSYRAVHKFCRKWPSGAGPLTDRKVVYHYNKGGNIYRSERAVLSDLGSSQMGVYWSPPFQSPVQEDELTPEGVGTYRRWHKSARKMKMTLEEDEAVYEYKMKPGECVIFDNRRVLHGRRAFDTSSGNRWLKGTYVENDSFNSRLRSLKLVNASHDNAEVGQSPIGSASEEPKIEQLPRFPVGLSIMGQDEQGVHQRNAGSELIYKSNETS